MRASTGTIMQRRNAQVAAHVGAHLLHRHVGHSLIAALFVHAGGGAAFARAAAEATAGAGKDMGWWSGSEHEPGSQGPLKCRAD